jgi:putative glycerol-1-phosphate prenyltransferase
MVSRLFTLWEMNKSVLTYIKEASKKGEKLLAILLDPDKIKIIEVELICSRIDTLNADFIFVGGSTVSNGYTHRLIKEIKKFSQKPIILFPGDYSQITNEADALLFLSLLSGRNPEYLIEQQIKAVPYLKNTNLEIIPTGYVLIDGGTNSSVLKVSKTSPISQENVDLAIATAVAGMYKGKQLIYLEAGSGAKIPVNSKIVSEVKKQLYVPLIVGGGIRTEQQINNAYNCGADIVVVGTAFEKNII